METKVTLDKDFDKEQSQVLQDLMCHDSILVPKNWISIFVEKSEKASEEDEDATACIFVEPAYRYATMWIYPGFWEQSTEQRRFAIVHELLHIRVAPMRQFGRSAIKAMATEDSPVYNVMESSFTRDEESVVQDLAQMWVNAVKPKTVSKGKK